MKCPHCGSETESGVAVVKAKPGILSMFAGINGYQHLWFVPTDSANPTAARAATFGSEGELLLKAYQAGAAFRCGNCKTVVLVECGAPVP